MSEAELVWGAPAWRWPAVVLACAVGAALTWGLLRVRRQTGWATAAAVCKILAVAGLAFCVVDPLIIQTVPKRGENVVAVLVDDSRSLRIHDPGREHSRGDELQRRLGSLAAWKRELQQDYDVRWYTIGERLESTTDVLDLALESSASNLVEGLQTVQRRFANQPLAAIVLLTDGNATDLGHDLNAGSLPPVVAVQVGRDRPVRDIRVDQVHVSQTNFEVAPVTIRAGIAADGCAGETLVVQLLSDEGDVLEEQRLAAPTGDRIPEVRFETRPEGGGVHFYQVRAFAESERSTMINAGTTTEATVANNRQLVVVDRGQGPYRVLYVAGRPNWDFKYLRRAVEEDAEIELLGLIRMARREPRFEFRGRDLDERNNIYDGFDNADEETAEQHDEPVLLRLGTVDEEELERGFPRTLDELFTYHAVILDDVEGPFFTRDQIAFLQEFVGRRGGGLLMMGGQECFQEGGYRGSPLADLLPVYLNAPEALPPFRQLRWQLTREGWLQSWVRLRSTADAESARLTDMPGFRTINAVGQLKPGASVVAEVRRDDTDQTWPALVTQRYGQGRTAALTVGDMWRSSLRAPENQREDLGRQWRQLVRWIVADVPRRVEVDIEAEADRSTGPVEVRVTVRDPEFEPMDQASVVVHLQDPRGRPVTVTAEPSDQQAGLYIARCFSRDPGAYRAEVVVHDGQGLEIGRREAGWTAQPSLNEFADLAPNREWLQRLASETGGASLALEDLNDVSDVISSRDVPVTERQVRPLWHRWWVLTGVLLLLAAEWGIRRWRGLP